MSQHPTSVQSSRQTDDSGKFYRCDLGGEWKPLVCFSKAQQKKAGRRINDASNSGMICREHNGEPTLEIRCQGHCNLVLPLSEFSKKSRRDSVNVCKACQSWRTNLDYEEIPPAGPQREMGPDEYLTATGVPVMRDEPLYLHQDEGEEANLLLPPVTGTLVGYEGSNGESSQSHGVGSVRSATSSHIGGTSGGLPPHLTTHFSLMGVSDRSPGVPGMSTDPTNSSAASTASLRVMSNGKPKPARSKSAWPRKSESKINKKERPSNANRAFDVGTCAAGHAGRGNGFDPPGLDDDDDEDLLIPVSPEKRSTTFIRQHPTLARASRMAEEMPQIMSSLPPQGNAATNNFPASPATVPSDAASISEDPQSPQTGIHTPTTQSAWLPPHLRPPMAPLDDSHRQLDVQSDISTANTVSTATTLREVRAQGSSGLSQPQPWRREGHTYTGWDSQGKAHRMNKEKTADTTSEASTAMYAHMPLKRVEASSQASVQDAASATSSAQASGQNTKDQNKGYVADKFDGGWLSEDEQ